MPETIYSNPLVESEKNSEREYPFDVNSPEKLERYLLHQELIAQYFRKEHLLEDEIVENLDDNPNKLLYRGMSPREVFDLINGESIKIQPYRFESVTDVPPLEDIQNASLSYLNAIPHGYDREEEYTFLAAVGFKPKGMRLTETGRVISMRYAVSGEKELLPTHKEEDVTVEGVLDLDAVEVIIFRFRRGNKTKTLLFKRIKR